MAGEDDELNRARSNVGGCGPFNVTCASLRFMLILLKQCVPENAVPGQDFNRQFPLRNLGVRSCELHHRNYTRDENVIAEFEPRGGPNVIAEFEPRVSLSMGSKKVGIPKENEGFWSSKKGDDPNVIAELG